MPVAKPKKLPRGLYAVEQPKGLEEVSAIFFEPIDSEVAGVMCPTCGSATVLSDLSLDELHQSVQAEFRCIKNEVHHIVRIALENIQKPGGNLVGTIHVIAEDLVD